MKALGALLGSRWVIGTLAVLLLALLVWFAGPFFAFAEVKPFESVVGRLVAILLIVVVWAVILLAQQMRAQRADRALAAAAAATPRSTERSGTTESAEEATLRQRFEEALATLRRGKGRGRRSLYAQPWYVIIGPAGVGKTTLLVNSGLEFPLAERFGHQPIQGVGGTRNCDWWFADQAVLLDTAGRYVQQDSDREADARGWRAFLMLLARARRRRPINGVIVAISVADLLTLDDQERLDQVRAIRARLAELVQELGLSFPVYLVINKCDLIAGFSEFFDDLDSDGRAQVWGTTFPLEASQRGEAAGRLGPELDLLIERLDGQVLERIASERDPRRRAAMFAFPQQVQGLRGRIVDFVRAVFDSPIADRPVWLRGVYLTSATQEGTPLDRLMVSMARSFGMSPAAVAAPAPGRGRAFFIERLLKDVLFEEAGLAGVNRRAEWLGRAAQVGAYVLVGLVAAGLLAAMGISYRSNAAYVQEVGRVADTLASTPPVATSDLLERLPRLDRLRLVVETATQPEPSPPWRMRWGLYQGRSLTDAARDAYQSELNATLAGPAGQLLANRLAGLGAAPDDLYQTLKAYLMLADPARLEPTLATRVIGRE